MKEEGRFRDQTAIITGAASGIGREIARQLLLEGANVVVNDISQISADQSYLDLEELRPGCVKVVAGNAAELVTIHRLVEEAITHFGGVNIAVANAGITNFGDFFDFDESSFGDMMDLNIKGSFYLSQAAARQMRLQGKGGRILFTSSVIGIQAASQLTAYAMTKAAINMLTRNLVVDLSPFNINVNAIAPGATLTSRTALEARDYAEKWSQVIPIGRTATPADIAGPALFLLSDEARHITGQTLVIDGGWSCISPAIESIKT